MAKRYFNWTLAIVLVVALMVLVVSAMLLRQWQRQARAERSLEPARQAYERGDWEQAAHYYGRYINIYRDDVEALLRYAESQLNRRPLEATSIEQARAAYRTILLLPETESTREAAVSLISLDLQRGAYGEAELYAGRYFESHDDPTIRRLLGLALRGRRQWAEAATVLADLIRDHPDEVLAYEQLGTLAETHPSDVNQPANYWFDEAVRQNPDSALAYIIRAGFHQRRDDREEALADLERAEMLDISDSQVRLRLIAGLANIGALDEARQHLEVLQAEAADTQRLYTTWAAVAMLSGSEEEMQRVAEEGLKALSKQPWDFMPVATELFIQAGQDDRASECIAQMRRKGVTPAAVAYLEGRIAQQRGHLQEAVNSWRRAIALGYNDYLNRDYMAPPAVRVALASVLERAGDIQSAIQQMRVFVSEVSQSDDPRSAMWESAGRLYLGQLWVRAGNWSAAMDEVRHVRRLESDSDAAVLLELQARIPRLIAENRPSGAPAWQEVERQLETLYEVSDGAVQVGILWVRTAAAQHKFEQAEALLDDLERRYPREASIVRWRAALYGAEAQLHETQGRAQEAEQKWQEAISVLRRAVEEFPDHSELAIYLAGVFEQQENLTECESVIVEAMARAERTQSRRNLGLWLAMRYDAWGQDDKLYELLAELAQEAPRDIQVKRHLLNLDVVAQDPVRAQELVDEIRTIEGQDGWQWRLEQARIWLSSPQLSDVRYAESVGLLQENLRNNPEDTSSRMLLARAYHQRGDLQPALVMYREALNRDPDNINVIRGIVIALREVGRENEAAEILAEAEKRNLYSPELRRLRLGEELRLSNIARDSEVQRQALASASAILGEILAEDPTDVATRLELAVVLARQANFPEAQAIINDLKTTHPQHAKVAQIVLCAEQGDAEQALLLCDELVDELNNGRAHIIRARTYAAFDEYDKALADFTRAIELEPQQPTWLAARADIYRSLRRLPEALADARRALAMKPDDLAARERVAILLMEVGGRAYLREAEDLVDGLRAAVPEAPHWRLLKANLLLTRNTVTANDQARRILGDLTRSAPELVETWRLLVRLGLSQGNASEAVGLATQGLGRHPDDKDLGLLKAQAEWAVGNRDLAIQTLERLAQRHPDDVGVIRRLAYAYFDAERPDAALRLIRERLAHLDEAQRGVLEVDLATIMYRNGDKAGAMSLLDELRQRQPDQRGPVLAQAELLAAEEDWSQLKHLMADWCAERPEDIQTPIAIASNLLASPNEAARDVAEALLREVLERYPDSIAALHRLAMLTLATQRGQEAAGLYRDILELDPNDVVAMNNLAWFLCEEEKQYQKALDLANRGLRLEPEYTDLIDTRGVIYHRKGGRYYEDAISDFTMAIRLYPPNAPALVGARFHLGRTYAAVGRDSEARRQLRQALEMHTQIGGLTEESLAEANRLLSQLQGGD